jgi:hypothetical protein
MIEEKKSQIKSDEDNKYRHRICLNISFIIISICAGALACYGSKNVQKDLSAVRLAIIFFTTLFIMLALLKITEFLATIIEGLCHRKDMKKCNDEVGKNFKTHNTSEIILKKSQDLLEKSTKDLANDVQTVGKILQDSFIKTFMPWKNTLD